MSKPIAPKGPKPEPEKFSTAFAVEAPPDDTGTFSGLCAVFNVPIDAYVPSIMEPGCFTKTLAERGSRIKVLYQHNPYEPIGKPTELKETNQGLYFKAKVSDTDTGRKTLTLMRDGVIDEMSIGFVPLKFDYVDADWSEEPVRRILEVRLNELSPVTWGANMYARIAEVNSLFGGLPYADAFAILTDQASAEKFIGKVLSTKNLTLAKDAIKALQALIDAAEPQSTEPNAITEADSLELMALTGRERQLMEANLNLCRMQLGI